MDLWRIRDRKPGEEVLTGAPSKNNGDPFVPE